jgi:hypothetical protein
MFRLPPGGLPTPPFCRIFEQGIADRSDDAVPRWRAASTAARLALYLGSPVSPQYARATLEQPELDDWLFCWAEKKN